ncbi:MAG TPA: diacylglycerol kinase family protein [Solirubrobacteraceae bacterium]|nr:diacylglycerol kinase family protein [Solirubrobacteraceae bacterium]
MDRAVRLIVNPSAGAGRAARLLPDVEAALRSHGIAFRVDRTTSIEHARELAREAREAGEIAAAMGGDGIAGAVAEEIHGTDALMAVVPGGRGNDLARKLGIGHDPVAAVDLIAAGRERRIDVAEAGGRIYVGILSAGFDSDVNEIANSTRLPLGTLVYLYGALRALARWKPAHWNVTVDGTEHEFTGYAVAIANSGVFGGGMWLVPDAQIDDGLLDVAFTTARPKLSYLRGLGQVFKGAHVDKPGFELTQGREITFRADRPFTAYADGDPIADLPATVRVKPRALRVIAP